MFIWFIAFFVAGALYEFRYYIINCTTGRRSELRRAVRLCTEVVRNPVYWFVSVPRRTQQRYARPVR